MTKTCFCPGCKTGYTSDTNRLRKLGKKNPSLFSTPKNPYLFELWKKAIPRADRILGPKDSVCELHFRKEDISRYFETKLPNGYIHRLYKGNKTLKPGVIPSIFPNVPGHSSYVENGATESKGKVAKHKKISDNKRKKKNDFPLQTGKENILMEVIVVEPLPGNSSTTQPSHLKEKQNAKKSTNSYLSALEKQAISEPEAPASTSLSLDAITENPSRQNMCYKIFVVSSTPDKLTKNYIVQNSSITYTTESLVPDTLTENYSKQNSSIRTITESTVPDKLTKNYIVQNSFITNTTEPLVPDTLTENYSEQNSSDRTITESSVPNKLTKNSIEQNSSITNTTELPVPHTLTENYSKQNSSDRTITESHVPDALTEKHSNHNICDIAVTEYPAYVAHPENYSDQSNDDTFLNDLTSAKPAESNANPNNCDEIRTEYNILTEPDIEEQVSFDFLKANINMFETTDSWWGVNTVNNFIVFSRWNSDYAVERRIVITEDLNVKVFLLDIETTIGQDMKKFSVYDIAKLIYRVENLKLCSDIDKKDRNCAGFLQGVFMCKRYNLCLNCIKWRKEEKKKRLKQLDESPNCIELLNFNLII